MKSEPRAREQLQSMSSLTIDQSTLVDTTFSRTADVNSESRLNLFSFSNKLSLQTTTMDDSTVTINEAVQLVEDRLASRVSIVFSHDFLEEFPSAAQTYFNEGKYLILKRASQLLFLQKHNQKNRRTRMMMTRMKMMMRFVRPHLLQYRQSFDHIKMINVNIDVSNKWEN